MHNIAYKKLAVQWLSEALCFVSIALVAESFRLRNLQLFCCKPLCDMPKYDSEIKNSIKNGILSNADIFDFRGLPNEQHFEELYNFCRENLDINSKKENISPNIFLYTNSYEINARALFLNGYNIILINMGLIGNCLTNYSENLKLNEFIKNKFPDLSQKFDNHISHLSFQLTTQFTYYHELAHLFQFCKKKNEIELQERKTDEGFDLIKHKLEINADTYASIAIATHLQQYIDKIFGNELTQKSASDTIKILGACLLNYVINFSDKSEVYMDKYSHPHPFLRLLNIILSIANHIESMPKLKEKNIALNGREIFNNILEFYQTLEDEGIFSTKFSDLVYKSETFYEAIIKYMKEILNFDKTDYDDAMEIWNRHIT